MKKTSKRVLSIVLTLTLLVGVLSTMFVAFAAEAPTPSDVASLFGAFSANTKLEITEAEQAQFDEMTAAYKGLSDAEKDSFPMEAQNGFFRTLTQYYDNQDRAATAGLTSAEKADKVELAIDAKLGRTANIIGVRIALNSLVDALITFNDGATKKMTAMSQADWGKIIDEGRLAGEMKVVDGVLSHFSKITTKVAPFFALYGSRRLGRSLLMTHLNQDTLPKALLNLSLAKESKGQTVVKNATFDVYNYMRSKNVYVDHINLIEKAVPIYQDYYAKGSVLTEDNKKALLAWHDELATYPVDFQAIVIDVRSNFWTFKADELGAGSALKTVTSAALSAGVISIKINEITVPEIYKLLDTFEAQPTISYTDFKQLRELYAPLTINQRDALPEDIRTRYDAIRTTYVPSTIERELPAFEIGKYAYPTTFEEKHIQELLDTLFPRIKDMFGFDLGSMLPTTASGILILDTATIGGLMSTIYTMLPGFVGDQAGLAGLNTTPNFVANLIGDEETTLAGLKASLLASEDDWTKFAIKEGDFGFMDADATFETTRSALIFALRPLLQGFRNGLKVPIENEYRYRPAGNKAAGPDVTYGLYETLILPIYEQFGLTAPMTSGEFTEKYNALAVEGQRNHNSAQLDFGAAALIDAIEALLDSVLKDPLNNLFGLLPVIAGLIEDGSLTDLIAGILATSSFIESAAGMGMASADFNIVIDGAMINGILAGLDLGGMKLPAIPWAKLASYRTPVAKASKGALYETGIVFEGNAPDAFMETFSYLYDILSDPTAREGITGLLTGLLGDSTDMVSGLVFGLVDDAADANDLMYQLLLLLGIVKEAEADPDGIAPAPTPTSIKVPDTGDKGFAFALAGVALAGVAFVIAKKRKED